MDQLTDRATTTPGPQVRLRYWAGARAAAGVEEDLTIAANSEFVRDRIRRAWDRDARVIP